MEDKPKEIFYCNLKVEDKKKIIYINNIVYKDINGFYKGKKVLSIDIICSLGFENKSKNFSLVTKSDEKRNNITGAYE